MAEGDQERRHADDPMRESEERLRLVVESVPDYAILTLDTQGRIRSWSTGAHAIFGFAESEALGQHVGIIFTPEDRQANAPEKEMRQAREQGRALDERWHVRKDGSRVYMSGVAAPLWRGSELMGYTKVARDLTSRQLSDVQNAEEHVRLEETVAARTRELAAANASLRKEIDERIRRQEERLQLLRELVNAQEKERSRIARELHDQLGQEVTALGLKLAALKATPRLAAAVRAEIESLEAIVKTLDADVEFLVWELRPTGLDDFGLADAMSDYAARWSRYFGIKASVETALAGPLTAECQTVLYRVAQEALNNIAKHARADSVAIHLIQKDGVVTLTVRDDGIGFDLEAAARGKTLGLIGMRERAALIEGTTTVSSKAGEGTVITVTVPCEPA